MNYNDKLKTCAEHLRSTNGGFSASEVYLEMKNRNWLSKLDTVLDIHKLLIELFGKPGE